MKLYFAGGAGEIGGSCIYIRIGGYGVLMDAGIRQGGTVSPLPDFRGIQERGGVDLILVSHAHTDHTGALPVISKAYPAARIYMTKMAMDQTRVLLLDSLKLMERKEEEIPQYSAEDVSAMMERIVTIPYQKEVLIRELSMKLTAYPAGHIAGAACLYLQTEEGECAPAFALDTGSLTVVPNMVDAAAGGAASSLNDSDIELSDGWFRPVPGTERVEQNLAFSIIEQCFEEQEIRPYKKGRKSDNIGVFLEMSFLSPALGLRCAGVLAEAARQTGWRIHISESVNQNALSAIAAELCGEYGVELLKNPSYLPVEGRLRITVSPDTPVPDAMREKYLARTGVRMV